jgi:hypothetical protein
MAPREIRLREVHRGEVIGLESAVRGRWIRTDDGKWAITVAWGEPDYVYRTAKKDPTSFRGTRHEVERLLVRFVAPPDDQLPLQVDASPQSIPPVTSEGIRNYGR